jgi:hypothetical protein
MPLIPTGIRELGASSSSANITNPELERRIDDDELSNLDVSGELAEPLNPLRPASAHPLPCITTSALRITVLRDSLDTPKIYALAI